MKKLKLIVTALLAACFSAPPGFRTANAADEADTSTMGLLCKGAGVDPADVRWRVAAGLDVKQAVDAALAQKQASAPATQPIAEPATPPPADEPPAEEPAAPPATEPVSSPTAKKGGK